MAKQLPPSKVLNYSIYSSSGHSASYSSENIRFNHPTDQASRWSSAANDQNQFIILKLDKMSLLESIGFGKFHKVHVCNLKEFKVFAGPNLNSLHPLLHTGLNNDTISESFPPDYSLSGLPDKQPIPVQYIKIVPLAAWGSNFNFSIWYIESRGWESSFDVSCASSQLVQATLDEYNKVKEQETTRLILKFLRQHNHLEAFTALQNNSGFQLEAPVVTQLHSLIKQNCFKEAEQLLLNLFNLNKQIFDQYLHENVSYQVQWTKLNCKSCGNGAQGGLDENGDYRMNDASGGGGVWPSARGGHQLLWDSNSQQLFLLGGWDGKRDLGDFWSFDPISSTWTLLSMNSEKEGGPSPRSCHKAVLHSSASNIYVLGRYIDPERRESTSVPCDFYRYSLAAGQWTRLSADVRAEGGPGCIYDHQMVVDEEDECIWVFGGRLLCGTNESSVYSGLYKFDLKTLQWTLINSDSTTTETMTGNVGNSENSDSSSNNLPPVRIPSRIGHSMLFDPQSRNLLILGGQRYKDQLSDFYKYSIDRNCVSQLWKNLQMVGGPDSGFTQRASIDQSTKELFVFSSLVRGNSSTSPAGAIVPVVGFTPPELLQDQISPSPTSDDTCAFWCFDLMEDKWSKINIVAPSNQVGKPPARFAHQIVYDSSTQTHFLFGGNPGKPTDPSARLDDLWAAKMIKSQGPEDILRHCQYLIRKAMFETMTTTDDIPSTLKFLQNDLAAVVNHADPVESASFRSLSAKLFLKSGRDEESPSIFDEIIKYLPKSMQPPISNL